MHETKGLLRRIKELEGLLEQSERKSDILTNLLKEANAEFEHALEKVTESETNIRAVFENAPEAIYLIDPVTRGFFYCNPYTLRWLGYSERELLSMRLDGILEPGAKGVEENLQKLMEQGTIRVQERRFRKKNGELVEAEVTGTIVEYQRKKYMAALVRDVTERKHVEELSRYKELFDNVGDPVFINDSRGEILEVNDVACNCFGVPRDRMVGMSLRDFTGRDQWPILAEMGELLRRGEKVQFELVTLTRTGEIIPFEMHARPITFKGSAAALSVGRDLSVRKKMEDALVKSARLKAVGEMASGVAHNFNNLLQMIMGASEAALAKLESGRVGEGVRAIQDIFNASQRGADIVRRIKEFRDVRPDKLDDAETFDLGELLEDAVNLTTPFWRAFSDSRRYQINLIKAPGSFVRGKSSAIYEVLVNIIKNAMEAMPHGGTLTLATRIDRNRVHLRIKDSGHGIAEDDLERIFQPFFTTKGAKSSGLGLASSYGIVKKHHGEMQVESTVGQGAAFTLTLPLADRLVNKRRELEAPEDADVPIRFLMIDDEVHILKAMEMYFEESKISLTTAGTGREGLAYLRQNNDFDVVMCDLGMDYMNGWEVGRAIKEYYLEKKRPKVPFLLYTGIDHSFDKENLEECGVDRIIQKPIPFQDLAGIIMSLAPSGRRI